MRYRLNTVEIITAAVLVTIVFGAVYEAFVALGWLSLGAVPGADAKYRDLVSAFTFGASLLGVGLAIIAPLGRNRLVPALAPAVAAYVVAHFYSFDAYDAPSEIRFSQYSGWSPAWIWAMVLGALTAATLAIARPRLGFLSAPVILVCMVSASLMGLH